MRFYSGIWLLLICSCKTIAQAQHGSIIGTINDYVSHKEMVRATVILISEKDSTRQFQVTNQSGKFKFPKVAYGKYRLTVSYVGYEEISQLIIISTSIREAGLIYLKPYIYQLSEVTIRKIAPMQVKQDTIIYNEELMSVDSNAVLEQLLHRLPGIVIQDDGSINAQGQTVQQILVDGKPFFGKDIKLATQNLPSMIIKSVQVFDRRSDQSVFTGIDDGKRIKTINIITKTDRQSGLFGQQTVGIGSNERFQAGISLNKFRPNRQISLLGQANNINQIGYSLANQDSPTSGLSSGQVGNISESVGTGLNYSDQWGKYLTVAGHFIFSDVSSKQLQTTVRKSLSTASNAQIKPEVNQSSLITDNQQTMEIHTIRQVFNFDVNYRINSQNIIQILPDLSFSAVKNLSCLNTKTQVNQQLLNKSLLNNLSFGNASTFTNTLLWMHRFTKAGRTLSAEFKTILDKQSGNSTNKSFNSFYDHTNSVDSLISTVNQRTTQAVKNSTNEWRLTYTEPISNTNSLTLRYQLAKKFSYSARLVTAVDSLTSLSAYQDSLLSNKYQSFYLTNQLGITFLAAQKSCNYSIGLDIQQASMNLQNDDLSHSGPVKRQYLNLIPSFSFQPKLAQGYFLRIYYQTQMQAPTIFQLQPVANTNNPLYIQLGNPFLRPEYTHLFSVNYSSFKPVFAQSIFVLLSAGLSQHRIISSIQIDSVGVQTIRPVNINGSFLVNGSISYGRLITIGPLKVVFNSTTNGNLAQTVNVINEKQNHSFTLSSGQILKANASIKQGAEIAVSATFNYQLATYSLQSLNRNQSTSTLLNGQLSLPLFAGIKLVTNFVYTTISGRSEGYNQPYILWNGYISYPISKARQAELRVQAFDLLNQNRSLSRTVTDTYVEDSQSQVLKRYIMVNFIYNLRQFGSSK